MLYHQGKFLLARSKGIHLITIFDKDWEENKEEIKNIIKNIVLHEDYEFFKPQNDIEYTNNDYDSGIWMKKYGYKEVGQEEPESFVYQERFKVYRCGRTIWGKEKSTV